MTTSSRQVLPSGLQLFFALVPVAAGQAYVIWLVFTGTTNYVQVVSFNLVELWLVWLCSMLFFSSSAQVFRQRAVKFFAMSGSVFFLLTVALLAGVSSHLVPGTRDQPLFRMIDLAGESLTGEFLLQSLLYVGLSLGLSLLVAFRSPDRGRTWYGNVVVPNGVTFLAIFLSLVLFFVSGMRDSSLPTFVRALVLVSILTLLRLVMVTFKLATTTEASVDAGYAMFKAGEE